MCQIASRAVGHAAPVLPFRHTTFHWPAGLRTTFEKSASTASINAESSGNDASTLQSVGLKTSVAAGIGATVEVGSGAAHGVWSVWRSCCTHGVFDRLERRLTLGKDVREQRGNGR